jgi:type I restriction enzyme M protein
MDQSHLIWVTNFICEDCGRYPLQPLHLRQAPRRDLAIDTILRELVRCFNGKAGERRDAVKMMAQILFLPTAHEIKPETYLLYDGGHRTGGMLTMIEETLMDATGERGKQVVTCLYGQEHNVETCANNRGDLLLKAEDDTADSLVGGPEHSTLANDVFPSHESFGGNA